MPLRGSDVPLSRCFDVAMLDLDGVVYVGPDAVPGVPDALAQARAAGLRLAFVTNNAARTPTTVAQHLSDLGIAADPEEVITSSQAAARYLADRLPAGAHVLVLGTTGLIEALRERDLVPVDVAEEDVAAVVQGYSPSMDWRSLAEGAVAINRGVPWVATNVDPTVPSARGPLPGNGSLVAALRHATGARPIVTGKPDPTMHRETVLRTGAENPVVVGDRLDTDIEGATAVGCASVLVFSGVTRPVDLLRARADHRPTYLGQDLSCVNHSHPEVHGDRSTGSCGRWRAVASRTGNDVTLTLGVVDESEDREDKSGAAGRARGGEGTPSSSLDGSGFTDDELDAVRALSAAAWSTSDDAADSLAAHPVNGDAAGAAVLSRLGLDH